MPAVMIAHSDARVIDTPNASMRTLASPSQGGTQSLSLWRVAMRSGQRGPLHTFDVEQVFHLLEGAASLAVDGERIDLAVGDTVVIPAAAQRQVGTDAGAVLVVAGPPNAKATPISSDGPGEPVSPGWIV